MHPRIIIGGHIGQTLQAEDIGKGLAIDHLGCGEFILGLAAESASVDDETDLSETPGRNQPIEHRDGELGLARSGCHRHQHRAAIVRQTRLDGLNGLTLVVSKGKAKVERLRCEFLMCSHFVDRQSFQQAPGRRPAGQNFCRIIGIAKVAPPDAGQCFHLLQIRATIR